MRRRSIIVPYVTEPAPFTPVFTGFGTVSAVEIYSWRVGANLFIEGNFTAGTATAVEARMTLGYCGSTSNVLSSAIPSIRMAGKYTTGATTTTHGGLVLIEPSVGYVTFGDVGTFGGSSINPLAKAVGSNIVSANKMSLQLVVPIVGWKANRRIC